MSWTGRICYSPNSTNLLFFALIELLQNLHSNGEAVGNALFVKVIIGVLAGVIIALQLVVQAGNAGDTETTLCESCGIGCAAEGRDPAFLARDTKALTVPLRSR